MIMNKKVFFLVVLWLTMLSFFAGATKCTFAEAATGAMSEDPVLKSIFNGQEPTIKLVNDKQNDLVGYSTKKFKDVKSKDWFINNLSKLVGLGGIDGYKDGTFRPQSPIKVSEFIKLLLAAAGYKQELDKVVWYKNYVEKSKELGVVEDTDNYNYDEGMKRKDMAKMICKLLKIEPKASDTAIFTDAKGIDTGWIDTAFNEYLIRGYYSKKTRTFKPDKTATRAEVTEMIIRALEYRDNPTEFKIKMKAYYKEIERQQDLADGTYYMPPLTNEQRARLNSYPENLKVETSVMSGQYMSNKEVVKHFTPEYLNDLIRKAKGYIEAFNNVDYHVVDLTFKNEVKKYLSPNGNYIDKDGNKISQDDELDKYVNRIKNDKSIAIGRFITDTSMIYICDDGRIRVKGVLQWIVIEDLYPDKLSVPLGKWHEDDIEIELAKWNDGPELFSKTIDLYLNRPINETPEGVN
jgi:hypothetical protein